RIGAPARPPTTELRPGTISWIKSDRRALVSKHPACQRTGVLALIDGKLAVHQEKANAGGVLVGFVKGGSIDVSLRIEHDHIRDVSRLQISVLWKLEDVRRQAAGATDGVFQGDELFGDGVAADLPRETAVTPRVRHRIAGHLGATVAG